MLDPKVIEYSFSNACKFIVNESMGYYGSSQGSTLVALLDRWCAFDFDLLLDVPTLQS